MGKAKIIQKRVKLNNRKTIVIDTPAKTNCENPMKEAAAIISKYPFIKPFPTDDK